MSVPITLKGGLSAGPVTTLYTVPGSGDFIGTIVTTPTTVYFTIALGLSLTINSVPRAGGPVTTLFTAASGEQVSDLVLGADGLYFVEKNDNAFPAIGFNIESIPLAGGAATVLYTAPADQEIDNLVGVGQSVVGVPTPTLFWTESAQFEKTPTVTTIKSAPTSAKTTTPLVATQFATVPIGTNVATLIGASSSGAPAFFSATAVAITADGGVTPLSGLYSIKSGGAPVLINSSATLPLIAFPEITGNNLLYNAPPGIKEYQDPSGPESTVFSNGVGVDSIAENSNFAGAFSMQLVYSAGACIYGVPSF